MATARIEPFGTLVEVRPRESVLAAILRAGKFVRYGCKHGGCGTCRARLLEGECSLDARTSFSLSDSDREEDIVLLCSTRMHSEEATFDLSGLQDLMEDEFHAGPKVGSFEAEVEELVSHARDLCTLRMRLHEPATMSFDAGQYLEVQVPGSEQWRAYSISSPPQQDRHIEITVKVLPGGSFSSRIGTEIDRGTRLQLRGPFGQFRIRLSHRPMIMVAGGSGMGPLRSMLHHLVAKNNERPVTLLYGARTPEGLLWEDELRALEAAQPWFEYVPVVSEMPTPGSWSGETGLVTDAVARRFDRLRGYEGYLCGPPAMVDAAKELLVSRGCKPRHVSFDRFVPSG